MQGRIQGGGKKKMKEKKGKKGGRGREGRRERGDGQSLQGLDSYSSSHRQNPAAKCKVVLLTKDEKEEAHFTWAHLLSFGQFHLGPLTL